MEKKLIWKPDINFLFYFLSLSVIIFSCDSITKDDIDHQHIEIDLNVKRLDQKLFDASSIVEIDSIIVTNRDVFNLYLELNKLPNSRVLSEMLYQRVQDSSVRVFYNQSQEIFGDFGERKKELKHLFEHVKYYYPDFRAPEVSCIFTAFLSPLDIIVSKRHIIIGLDYFLGPEAMYVQNDPQYILDRYRPENLVPMFIGLGISNFYNETDHEDQTLVAEMIYYGKAHYFLSKTVHDISDSQNLGFSEDDIAYFRNKEKILWAYFVERSLLFETNRIEIQKYISERPKTIEIEPECPGRVGRWMGYEIVKSYMEKNELSLQELMAEKDAQKIFRLSGYNPSR
ncbi:hypothetical protein HZR84_05875 [Hyphobacterium sp. CCMP332]|nr:hypothetical protein HZR84_05875 [Hyphobacterium sp. CCMP332]